jgi:ATP-binding cassette subfamily C (CFTR/MRP) protein 1
MTEIRAIQGRRRCGTDDVALASQGAHSVQSGRYVHNVKSISCPVYTANRSGGSQPNIGRGIAMALGLWGLVIFQSICQHQFFFRSMAIGVLARATLVSAVYKQALSMTVESRSSHPSGKLTTLVSSDVSVWSLSD